MTTYTSEQIEKAARILCAAHDKNPDVSSGFFIGRVHYRRDQTWLAWYTDTIGAYLRGDEEIEEALRLAREPQ